MVMRCVGECVWGGMVVAVCVRSNVLLRGSAPPPGFGRRHQVAFADAWTTGGGRWTKARARAGGPRAVALPRARARKGTVD